MNNTATTLEQSRHLLKSGLNPNTSDMYWDTTLETPMLFYNNYQNKADYDSMIKNGLIPAWSLYALFDLLPEHTQVPPSLKQNKYIYNYHNGIVEFGDDYHKEKSTNLFDAAFEMVCWLKENGKI